MKPRKEIFQQYVAQVTLCKAKSKYTVVKTSWSQPTKNNRSPVESICPKKTLPTTVITVGNNKPSHKICVRESGSDGVATVSAGVLINELSAITNTTLVLIGIH